MNFNRTIIILSLCFVSLHSCNANKTEKFIGVVSSASPEASKVGGQIFLKGGNAIDVAVAVSFALGVTEPAMSGLGGGTQVLLSLQDQKPIAINGTTLSPINTPTHIKDTLSYHRRSTIPSTVKVLDYLWRTYGSGKLTWKDLLNPAIDLAENGFSVGEFRGKVYAQYEDKLLASKFNTTYFLFDGIRIPKDGEIIKQPQLAKTLRRLANFGADDFYNGEIAKDIVTDMETNGGWITIEDLNNFSAPKELEPLSITYKGMAVYSQPPPCGGWTTLLALNLMNEISKDSVLSNLDFIKALYLAHKDREDYPITDLVNYDSIAQIKLSKSYANKLLIENQSSKYANEEESSGETTHFSVVDADGNAIAVTASINAYFGALAASEKLGFLYNTYMDDFIFESPEHPFAIRPNAMAYSSMSPTIVQEKGENILVLGSPGSARIISSVAQLTAKWIEKKDMQTVIEQPRIHVTKNNIYFESKQDTIYIDKSFLKANNLHFKTPSEKLMLQENLNPYYGGIHAIAKENGEWIGVADSRRDGKSITIINTN